jgi:hypothetical protein
MNTNDTTKWNVSDILKKFTQDQSAKLQEEQMKEQLKQSMMAQQAQQLSQFVPGMASENPESEFDQYAQGYRQGGIKLDPAKKGTFKAQATRMGMSVQEAARHILSNREKYSPGMVKKANFARNFAKEEGGQMMRYGAGGDMMACPEGLYWDENSQTCVPQVNAEEFFKNWYSKRTLPFDEIGNKTYENVMRKILPMYNPESKLLQNITDNSVPYEFQSMIADDPGVMGELVYNQKTYAPEKILLKESLKDNPTELSKTIVSEESTRIRDPYNDKMLPAEQLILNNAIKSYEEGWGDMKKGPEEEAAYNMYNYVTDPKQDNIQSALFEVRQAKNLKPDQVITEQDIENWRKEAEANGALDMNSPNFDDALYKLFRLSKDSKSMTELFNYIASNTDTKTSNPNVASARYGGDFGYLPNFF